MDLSEPGTSGVKFLSRKDIYMIIKESQAPNFDKKLDLMVETVINKFCKSEDRKSWKQKISLIKHQFKTRWQAAHKKEVVFESNNKDWLNGSTSLQLPITETSTGRPKKTFAESSERSKRRKTEELRLQEVEKLSYATHMKLRASGNIDASNVVKDLIKSPSRGQKYRSAIKKFKQVTCHQLSTLDALSMYVEAGLTRSQYEIVRSSNKKFYPCYSILQKAKNECYPIKESYRVTATCAEINLQDLLNHTASRLIMHLKEVMAAIKDEDRQQMELICKWGCDGSQQVRYKQKFENEMDSDANIFQSSMVPLQLVYGKNKNVLWQNPTPSSPRYCRPIRIRFLQESADITNQEIQYMNSKINALECTETQGAKISHTMLFTMVDGKVCNAATHTTSTMKCYICGATSKEFNNLTKRREVRAESLQFGLSILHARIRFFENLLHLSYKLPIKKWQLRQQADKDIVQQKKKEIQNKFRNEMGLIVDVPKANFGNSNDGNTSRRFFADHQLSASITGIDVNLMFRFKIILEALSSGHKINVEAFENYARETEELYVQLYEWHPMSPTIHKILRHGAQVISSALLPIGQLSEEAAEARNKHFRDYRLNYSRKFSRESCNLDVINRLLLTSDPLITGLRTESKKKSKPFHKETLDLLLSAEPTKSCTDSDSDVDIISDDDV
ncbi:uncharacterized protein LOC142978911 [Anticarsia gemmatalis]|uniref:uncharacterized protein LOC142978911 n=1 Tax=Anticarsia gemmatalis TaxID=129554 RepID=UPI003F76E18E